MKVLLSKEVVILMFCAVALGDKEEKYTSYYKNIKRAHKSEPIPPKAESSDGGSCELKVECKNRKGEPGYKGEPGRTGFPGLPGLPGSPGASGESLKQILFFAALHENMGPLDGATLTYGDVMVNAGNGYSATTGRFTAPADGVYAFNIIVAAQEGHKAAVQLLYSNPETETDNHVVVVWAESIPNWATSSNTVYFPLREGQEVYLIARRNLQSYYYAGRYTTFSGLLVANLTQ